jgi:DUF1009 family protein
MNGAPPASQEGPLAIICGGGSLPLAVAESVTKRGRAVLLLMLRGAAEGGPLERFPHHWIYVGQVGKAVRLAKAAGCRDLSFIGSLVRPAMWQTRPDFKAFSLLPQLLKAFRGGDNHLLSEIGKIVEQLGFRIMGAHEVAPEIVLPEGRLGSIDAVERDRADIALGFDYLRATGPFDVGQAVVVAGRHVIAVVAAEGTDQMLARVATMRKNGRLQTAPGSGVLVKAAKRGQDHRFDLPSIGPETVAGVSAAGLAGIAVTAGETIIAEPERTTRAADKANIFVIGARDESRP